MFLEIWDRLKMTRGLYYKKRKIKKNKKSTLKILKKPAKYDAISANVMFADNA